MLSSRVIISSMLLALSTCVAYPGDLLRLGKDVYLLRGDFPEGRQPDGNSVLLLAPAGLVVIDTGRHRVHTQRIVDFAQSRGHPIAAIINTHWHLDHLGGNVLLREAYPQATVYASAVIQDAQRGFLQDYRAQLAYAIAAAAPGSDTAAWRNEITLIDAGAKLLPNVVIDATQTLRIAGRRLDLHLERSAATEGDLWLRDSARGIVIAGDLVTLPVPFFDTACASGWEDALGRIATTSFDRLVPGHGPPMTRTHVQRYHRSFRALRACAASTRTTAECSQEWLDNAGPLIEKVDVPRVPAMIDYYVKVLRQAPEECSK